jgi:hypothetical protein
MFFYCSGGGGSGMNSPEGRQFLSALQQSNQTPQSNATASDGSDQRTVFSICVLAEGRIFVGGGGVGASAICA